jgi:hypothetical protein
LGWWRVGDGVVVDAGAARVASIAESMLWALEEFLLSMLGAKIAVDEQACWPGAFPQRLLLIDGFGTFASMAARDGRQVRARRTATRGTPYCTESSASLGC